MFFPQTEPEPVVPAPGLHRSESDVGLWARLRRSTTNCWQMARSTTSINIAELGSRTASNASIPRSHTVDDITHMAAKATIQAQSEYEPT